MKAVLKDARTEEVLYEIYANLEEELTDKEIQEIIADLDLTEE